MTIHSPRLPSPHLPSSACSAARRHDAGQRCDPRSLDVAGVRRTRALTALIALAVLAGGIGLSSALQRRGAQPSAASPATVVIP